MAAKLTLKDVSALDLKFSKYKTVFDVCKVLNISENTLTLHALNPKYNCFKIPKNKGGYRTIEAPEKELKDIQRRLNLYLQAFYFLNKPKASHGFIITPKYSKQSKNILSNALTHLSNNYLLNVDFKDFFHQINKQHIFDVFNNKQYWNFNKKTAEILANLCSFKKRLPMGAPTSPALSNIATIPFDNMMEKWAKNNNLKYSRFVDDLSFSSNTFFEPIITVQNIEKQCLNFNLKLNTSKTLFFDKDKPKIITGILLDDPLSIPNKFYDELNDDLLKLKHLIEVQLQYNEEVNHNLLKKLKQQIKGQLNFIRQVEGITSNEYIMYQEKYKTALTINNVKFFNRWVNFGYF